MLAIMQIFINNQTGLGAVDPTGITFGWRADTGELAGVQTGSRVVVEEIAPEKMVAWDSGWQDSDQSVLVPYGGPALSSASLCQVTVHVRDSEGKIASTQTAFLTTFTESDLKGIWIGSDRTVPGWLSEKRLLPARYLRKQFHLDAQASFAPMAICGLGCYELYVNGKPVSDAKLAPALSNYDKRVYYNMFDLAPFLTAGNNEIMVILGNGRYFSPRLFIPTRTKTFGLPSLFCTLRIHGQKDDPIMVRSDSDWQVSTQGPVRENNEYDGETYDARLEIGLADSLSWEPVATMPAPWGVLTLDRCKPIRIIEEFPPIEIARMSDGHAIVDMGQNMVGYCRLKVRGKAGDQVRLRFAERLEPSRELYLANIRSAAVTDTYTLKGVGEEIWEPRFTYHGFRYVEVTGYPGTISSDSLTACVLHDNLDTAGSFDSSDVLLNKIDGNMFRGIRGNYRSIPTDCPQRDERQGWLGDRAFGSKGESYYFDIYPLYRKWLQDMADCQLDSGLFPSVAPDYWPFYPSELTWSGTFLIIIQMLLDQYGDYSILDAFYEPAARYLEYHYRKIHPDGLSHEDTYGDWCVPPESPELIHSEDPSRKTDGSLLASAYLYHATMIFSGWARMRGDKAGQKLYVNRASALRDAFNRTLFNVQEGYFGNGSVTAQIVPLAFGLVDEEHKPSLYSYVRKRIEDVHGGHVASGLVGMQQFYRTLTEGGLVDIALNTVLRSDFPGIGYMIENGATTVWELWNGDTANPAMNSGNHVMLIGDLHVWLRENLAGIRPKTPGFMEILLSPTVPERLTRISVSYMSRHGEIRSSWKKEASRFKWEITIPFNTKAEIQIPGAGAIDVRKVDGTAAGKPDAQRRLYLGSGSYFIETGLGTGWL